MIVEAFICLCTVIYMGTMAGLFGWCFRKDLGTGGKVYLGILILVEMIYNLAAYWYRIPDGWNLVHQVVVIGVLLFFIRKRLLEGMFVTFLIMNYLVSLFCIDTWIYGQFYGVYGMYPTGITMLLSEVAGLVPLILYVKFVTIPLIQIDGVITRSFWYTLWLIPVAFYCISCYGYYLQNSTGIQTSSMCIYLLMNNVLNLFICWIMGASLKESEDMAKLKNQNGYLSIMAKQQEAMHEKIEQARRMRHDLRHFMILMNDFIQRKDMNGMKQYMLEYSTALSQHSWNHISYCANDTVNAVAGYYLEMAEKEGVQTQFDCRISGELPLTAMEVSGILGNLLENALEACRRMPEEGQRYIRMSMRYEEGGFFILVIENSFSGEIRKKAERFISSKRNEPGIGLESVRNMIERAGGILKVEHENGVFRVNIFLS